MSVTVVGSSVYAKQNDSTEHWTTAVTGVQVGDLILIVFVMDPGFVVGGSDGWKRLGGTWSNEAVAFNLLDEHEHGRHDAAVFWRIADSHDVDSCQYRWQYTGTGDSEVGVIVIRGQHPTTPFRTYTRAQSATTTETASTAPSTAAKAGSRVLAVIGGSGEAQAAAYWAYGAMTTQAGDAVLISSGTTAPGTPYVYCRLLVNTWTVSATGATGNRTATANAPMIGWTGYQIEIQPPNQPPNAPILTGPVGGAVIDRNSAQRFTIDPSDPDDGDSTSETRWRYRVVGAATWTTVAKTSPNAFYDFAPGTFLGVDYEWQAATKDAAGEPLSDADLTWSASSFFTASDPPNQPTWTDPLNGQTIASDSYTGTISAPDVDESEWRLVADSAGVIDEATVLHGPVVKTTGDLRSHTFTELTNGVTVWWQARTKFEGLWSDWAAVRTPVSFTPPAAPTVSLMALDAEGSLWVSITNPTPGVGEPSVEYNSVEVDDGDGWVRVATFLATNAGWQYRTPVSGRDYSGNVRVTAHGDNGTTATTTVPAGSTPMVTEYYGGSY